MVRSLCVFSWCELNGYISIIGLASLVSRSSMRCWILSMVSLSTILSKITSFSDIFKLVCSSLLVNTPFYELKFSILSIYDWSMFFLVSNYFSKSSIFVDLGDFTPTEQKLLLNCISFGWYYNKTWLLVIQSSNLTNRSILSALRSLRNSKSSSLSILVMFCRFLCWSSFFMYNYLNSSFWLRKLTFYMSWLFWVSRSLYIWRSLWIYLSLSFMFGVFIFYINWIKLWPRFLSGDSKYYVSSFSFFNRWVWVARGVLLFVGEKSPSRPRASILVRLGV